MNKKAFYFPWCKYNNISIEVIIKSQTSLSYNLYKFNHLPNKTFKHKKVELYRTKVHSVTILVLQGITVLIYLSPDKPWYVKKV